MIFAVTSEQMKSAEENSHTKGVTFFQLMENAGKACFEYIDKFVGGVSGKTFAVLCGRGNNGGDGLVIASEIVKAGGEAIVVYTIDLPSTECARKAHSAYGGNVPTALYMHNEDAVKLAVSSCDCVVDCIFGTGFHGELDGRQKELLEFVNAQKEPLKIAVDLPTGVNANTGEIAEGSFKADVTLTLGAMKIGQLNADCSDFCGEIFVLDIGIAADCYEGISAVFTPESVLKKIPSRKKSSNKGSFGKVLNIAGSGCYNGAAMLSSKAALRMGAGLVTLATPMRVVNAIAAAIPEAVFLPLSQDEKGFAVSDAVKEIEEAMTKATVITIGCGLGKNHGTSAIVENVLKNAKCPVVLDADGINCAAELDRSILKDCENLIITPHPGEFGRLLKKSVSEVQSNRVYLAKEFAEENGIVVLLKGANTVIAAPDGRVYINPTGNPAMAKAGSGDVLTGIIGGLLAQGLPVFEAAVTGAYIHGLCGDIIAKRTNRFSLLANDICEQLTKIKI